MGRARMLVLGTGLVALAPLLACGGRSLLEGPEQAGSSSTAGGAPGASANPSPTAGAHASSAGGSEATAGASTSSAGASVSSAGAPCCSVVGSCDTGDETFGAKNGCPNGAICYSRPGCCGALTHCAHYDTTTAADAGSPTDGTACSLLGTWNTHSAPWNNESTDAVITFKDGGTLTGQPLFIGSWLLDGSTLTISNTVGADMTCQFSDRWILTFTSDCLTAPLVPIDSGCTGARRYLDWDVTLTRVVR